MAKRRVNRTTQTSPATPSGSEDSEARIGRLARNIAAGGLGGVMVYTAYFTSDSIAVEQGGALWLAVFAFAILGLLGIAGFRWTRRDAWIDACVWAMAAWMMIAAFASDGGNLRMATNEAWLWVTAAAIISASRRLLADTAVRRALIGLAVVITAAMAVETIHQDWVSLPGTRAEYRADPERVLRGAGIDAPPNSSLRMVFENRLFDGGPSATFALANSLAAVLLVAVLIPALMLRTQWRDMSHAQRCAWGFVMALGCVAMLATRSRSALISVMSGLGLVALAASGRVKAGWWKPIIAVAGAGGLLAIGLAVFGKSEWIEQAPASLSFRLQYWRSTWDMVVDRPLFGCGPGNFQAIYDRYRESSTTEQIADPHNFVFETLASGGFVGLGLLMAIAGSLWVSIRGRENRATETEGVSRAVLIGAVAALACVWVLGWIVRSTPDTAAAMFALPISLAMGWCVWPSLQRINAATIDKIFAISLLAMLVHLCAAGGFTVPGVAAYLWIAVAVLSRTRISDVDSQSRSMPVIVLAIGLMVSLLWMSLGPVSNQSNAMSRADFAIESGITGTAASALQEAVDADSWNVDSVLYQSQYLSRELIAKQNDAAVRSKWRDSSDETVKRAGESPAVYRQLGSQRMHLYQVFGKREDLESAESLFAQASQWSPSNQWLAAQLSEIARELGKPEDAKALAEEALRLSKLGDNLERALWLQQIYVAKPIGRSAARQPVRQAARDVLPPS